MKEEFQTTVVTAGDQAYAWGVYLLIASMRMNGMNHPVVVGAMGWTDDMKSRVCSLGNVVFRDLPKNRRCVACQKPLLMACDEVKTEWVCWADSDAVFVGNCSEWIVGDNPDEIVIRKCDPVPPDFTPENIEIWRRDIKLHFGSVLEKCRYATRVNDSFFVINRKWKAFLNCWEKQIENVLPPDVEIIMEKGSPYYQTDESVLGSLLCLYPDAPMVSSVCRANDGGNRNRQFAHIAYNPKPWQMWNVHSLKWHMEVMNVVQWLEENNYVKHAELPCSLRSEWYPLYRRVAWLAPWVWKATKLKRRLLKS